MAPKPGKPVGWGRRLAAAHREQLNVYLAAHRDLGRKRGQLHLLLGALLSHCSQDNLRADGRAVCWPSLNGLAAMYGYTTRNVRRMVRDLEDTGVVAVLNGIAVPKENRGDRPCHDGTFVKADGSRQNTSARAYQFVFSIVVPGDTAGAVAGAVEAVQLPAPPVRRSAERPAAPTPVSRVPPFPPDKREEIEAEIGAAECREFTAWVMREWRDRLPDPPRKYDFWNARFADWKVNRAGQRASEAANLEAERTHRAAAQLRSEVAGSRHERDAVLVDIKARLAQAQVAHQGVGRV